MQYVYHTLTNTNIHTLKHMNDVFVYYKIKNI